MSETGLRPLDQPSTEIDPEARTFSASILVSAVRCTLTYVVLPFLLPALRLSDQFKPAIGLVIGVVAIGANIWTIRRFWAADHRLKWPVTVISGGILVLLTVLVIIDIVDLTS